MKKIKKYDAKNRLQFEGKGVKIQRFWLKLKKMALIMFREIYVKKKAENCQNESFFFWGRRNGVEQTYELNSKILVNQLWISNLFQKELGFYRLCYA